MKMKRNMNNQEIAHLLKAISAALEVKGENRFRVVAYDRASVAVEHATSEVKDLWDDNKLTTLPGIGANITQHLDELFKTGRVKHFEQVFKNLPPAMFELLDVPGIGAKTAYYLCQKLKLNNPKTVYNDLIKAAKKGRIAPIEGFGEKSQADILGAIREYKKGRVKKKRMPLSFADSVAKEMISYLEECPSTLKADPLGSLKRRVATVGDIDIAVATKEPNKVIEWLVNYPKKKKVIEKGPSGASILLRNGLQIDLRVQKPKAYGSMLQYFIGSKHHNIRLRELALKKRLSLSEHGIKKGKKLIEYASEETFYKALNLPWMPPEIREDTGEIEAAQVGRLPKLVELADVKGDLHIHSNFPIEESHDPGTDTMETMVKQAYDLNYEYIGFAEHNPSISQHSGSKIIDLIKRKKDRIDQINSSRTKKLLKMILNSLEVDIRPNGDLAVPSQGLNLLDYAVASVHTSFKLDRKKMTDRVLKGLSHPKVKILGHPVGRKIGYREGYELDWDRVFDFCKKNNKWLEINAFPDRLDLPDFLVREAVKNGVKMVVNTDSHAAEQMRLIEYGVSVARRGWAEKTDIINTLPWSQFKAKI